MMELTREGISCRQVFESAGIQLPDFDVVQMQAKGREHPRWVHIGAGNIFRVFIARIAHEMISSGHDWPITAVHTTEPEKIERQLIAHDLLSLGVVLNPDGARDLQVIAGISEALATRRADDFERLTEIFRSPELSLVSLTITEKGYAIHTSSGSYQPQLLQQLQTDPHSYHAHTMAQLAGLLLHRFEAGAAPLTLLSADNFSHNGDKLRDSITSIAREWRKREAVPEEFLEWLSSGECVAFPISVMDKITPRPSVQISQELAGLGFTDMNIETIGHSHVAGFVNTEPAEYFIIEDKFAGDRPPFEDFGVRIVDRQMCDDFESMKVTTCLNPLHTALAVAGCLLRFPTIDAQMRDPELVALVRELGWKEGLPVVADPVVVKPEEFLREVLEVRFPNQYLPDDPARIAMDTSQKVPIRFGETLKKYRERGMNLDELHAIPLVFALWCRYLMGIGDDGEPFAPAPDPLYEELHEHVADFSLGTAVSAEKIHEALKPILSNTEIFRTNLYESALAAKTEKFFARLIAGVGAVRATLDEEYGEEYENENDVSLVR